MRRHLPSPAMIVALAALVLALTGSALAARHYLITSTKQISPKVLKKLHGRTGATGPVGATGPAGAAGPKGDAGPLLDTLPSGRTLTGVYDAQGWHPASAAAEVAYAEDAVSFPIPLASAPTPHFIAKGGAPTATCPGTATAPTAAPGHACLYEGGQASDDAVTILNPTTQGTPGATRFGFKIDVSSLASTIAFFYGSWGTWAVTAP